MVDLTTLMQRKAKLESEIARRKKKEKEAKRRADTRRKIILGAVVDVAVQEGAVSESLVRGLINRFASERDKAVFDSDDFEKPETVPAPAETAAADSGNQVAGE